MISLALKPLSLSDCSSFKLYIYVVKSDGDGSFCYFVIQYVITPKLQSPWFKGPWPSHYKSRRISAAQVSPLTDIADETITLNKS